MADPSTNGSRRAAQGDVTPRGPVRPARAPVCPRHVADDPELVEVRCLLAALRPDRDGPLGWAPDGHPPPHQGSAAPVAVQAVTPGGDVPRGAFQGTPSRTPGTLARERVETLATTHPQAAVALSWLQAHGTLAGGLGALYAAAGAALATRSERERWTTPELGRLGARAVGRARVTLARAVWWGESEQEVHGA